ncbi:hypothetical protein OQA88_5620 [Cercophora sp. LCS_1]
MEQIHMAGGPPPSQSQHGQQLSSQMSTGPPEPAPSPAVPQRLPDPAALKTNPSPALQSPPQYHMQPRFQPDITSSSPLVLRPLHDPAPAPSFSNAPSAELPPIQSQQEKRASGPNHSLPSLSSVTGGLKPSPEPPAPTHWPSLNPYTVYYAPGHTQPADRMDAERMKSAASPERYHERRSASVSLDDPDVRMAAEALGDLRADFVSSPPSRATPLPGTPRDYRLASPRDSNDQARPEPLLSLITASHPLLATTIEGATSAYSAGKNFSPHLKTGAEYIEESLAPVAKTIGTVGRKTGVEGGLRWILGGVRKHGRRSGADLEAGERGNHKRRRAKLSDKEKEAFDRSFPDSLDGDKERRTSISTIDTLPAYDDHRSPAYTEALDLANQADGRPGSSGSEWKTRIVVSTSSLGVAMREESLRNLKYCLERLRQANSCVSDMLVNLQTVVEQYDAVKRRIGDDDEAMSDLSAPSVTESELLARINTIKTEIATNLFSAISFVSTYAGSALPENVRKLIHEQFVGLPQRYRILTMREAQTEPRTDGDQGTAMREGARKVALLAKEGLQMIARVSDAIDRTIKSAEEWCKVLGKGTGDRVNTATGTPEAAPSPAQWAARPSHPSPLVQNEDARMTG